MKRFRLLILSAAFLFALDAAGAGRIAYVERTPVLPREGLARFYGVSERRLQVSSNIYNDLGFNIYTIDERGQNRVPMTDDGMSDLPRWSWNGEWIAYRHGPEPVQRLYIVRADGSDRKEVLDGVEAVHRYWWSHDNKKILASVTRPRSNGRLEGRVIHIETGKVSRLSREEWQRGWNHWEPGKDDVVNPRPRLYSALSKAVAQWPVWSPDAKWIAFTSEGFAAVAHVESVSNSGNWHLQKKEPLADRVFQWSLDGRRFLFSLNGYIAFATLENGRIVHAAPVTMRQAGSGTFNAEGTRVVFNANPAGIIAPQLFVVDADGENETQITNSPRAHLDPQWQPIFEDKIDAP